MNMVRFIGNKKVLIAIGGISLFLVGMQRAFTPQSLTISCDPRWTSEYQHAIKKQLENISIRTIGAYRLRNQLQPEFPFIKDISISYESAYRAQINIIGWIPKVLMQSSLPGNKDYALCTTGQVLEKHYFSQEALQGLPTMILEGVDFETKRLAQEFIDTALRLSNKHFEVYTIVWHSKTEILLHDKEKKIRIISDMNSIHDPDRFTYLEQIYAQEESYKNGMKADIRLKDSIVCAPITNYTRTYEESNTL